MFNKVFLLLRKVVAASLLIYSYDLIIFSSMVNIPINFFTIFIVAVFDIPGMLGLILLSFTF